MKKILRTVGGWRSSSRKPLWGVLMGTTQLVVNLLWPGIPHGFTAGQADASNPPGQSGFIRPLDTSGEDGKFQPPVSFEMDVAAPLDKWKQVERDLKILPSVRLKVWYDFGSLQLVTHTDSGERRIELWVEHEMSEDEKVKHRTCLFDVQRFRILEWVRKDGEVRRAPPASLAEVSGTCRE